MCSVFEICGVVPLSPAKKEPLSRRNRSRTRIAVFSRRENKFTSGIRPAFLDPSGKEREISGDVPKILKTTTLRERRSVTHRTVDDRVHRRRQQPRLNDAVIEIYRDFRESDGKKTLLLRAEEECCKIKPKAIHGPVDAA